MEPSANEKALIKTDKSDFELIDTAQDWSSAPFLLRLGPLGILREMHKIVQLTYPKNAFNERFSSILYELQLLPEISESDSEEEIKEKPAPKIHLINISKDVVFAFIPPDILEAPFAANEIAFFFQAKDFIERKVKEALNKHYPDQFVRYKDIVLGGVIAGPGRLSFYDKFASDSLAHSYCAWKLPGEKSLIIEDPRIGIFSGLLDIFNRMIVNIFPTKPKLQSCWNDEYCSIAAISLFFKALDFTKFFINYRPARKLIRGFELVSSFDRDVVLYKITSADVFEKIHQEYTLSSLGLRVNPGESQENILTRFHKTLGRQCSLASDKGTLGFFRPPAREIPSRKKMEILDDSATTPEDCSVKDSTETKEAVESSLTIGSF